MQLIVFFKQYMGFVCTMEDLMQRNKEHEYIVIIYQIYFVQGLEF